MAAILGCIRSFLLALPFLRAFTDTLVELVNLQQTFGWDHKVLIPPTVTYQLKDLKLLLQNWQGRPFPERANRELHSDSSTLACAGVDILEGGLCKSFGERTQSYT
jgi:hypothetical protein